MNAVATSCLERLRSRDFNFIEESFSGARGSPGEFESLYSDTDSLVALLDHEVVFRAVTELAYPLSISPELYFFVLVRRSLKHAGIEEVEIADYVAATLANHAGGGGFGLGRRDRSDRGFTYHLDFIEEMNGLSAYERFFLEVQCGNHFMVLTGLFPGFLEHRADRRGAPGVGYYEGVARNAYLAASDHPLADEFAVRSLYPRLAERFSETRRALNRMAEDYLFLGG